jgi:hypothetical protein
MLALNEIKILSLLLLSTVFLFSCTGSTVKADEQQKSSMSRASEDVGTEWARKRLKDDGMYCLDKFLPGINMNAAPTSEQKQVLDRCLNSRGWQVTDLPGAPDSSIKCYAIDGGQGAYITLCP